MFVAISRHYLHVERERTTAIPIHPRDIRHRLIVPIAKLNHAARQSLAYARSISPDVTAVHVTLDTHTVDALRAACEDCQKQLSKDALSRLDIIYTSQQSL